MKDTPPGAREMANFAFKYLDKALDGVLDGIEQNVLDRVTNTLLDEFPNNALDKLPQGPGRAPRCERVWFC